MSFKFLINLFFLTVFLFLNSCSTVAKPNPDLDIACEEDPKWFTKKDCPKGYICTWYFESSVDRAGAYQYSEDGARAALARELSSIGFSFSSKDLEEGKNNNSSNNYSGTDKSSEAHNDLFKTAAWKAAALQDFTSFANGTSAYRGNPSTKKCNGEYTAWASIRVSKEDVANRYSDLIDKVANSDQVKLSDESKKFINEAKEKGDQFVKKMFDF